MSVTTPSILTPTLFRQLQRVFRDPDRFPDTSVQAYLAQAAQFLTSAWGAPGSVGPPLQLTTLDYGTMWYVAHYLALEDQEMQAGALGGPVGEVRGPKTSKSVRGVSVSMDTAAVTNQDGPAFWNMTRYGIQFWDIARKLGAGGIQVQAGFPTGQLTPLEPAVPGQDFFWGLWQ